MTTGRYSACAVLSLETSFSNCAIRWSCDSKFSCRSLKSSDDGVNGVKMAESELRNGEAGGWHASNFDCSFTGAGSELVDSVRDGGNFSQTFVRCQDSKYSQAFLPHWVLLLLSHNHSPRSSLSPSIHSVAVIPPSTCSSSTLKPLIPLVTSRFQSTHIRLPSPRYIRKALTKFHRILPILLVAVHLPKLFQIFRLG